MSKRVSPRFRVLDKRPRQEQELVDAILDQAEEILGSTSVGVASFLELAKAFDLNEKRFAHIVSSIANLITSRYAETRLDVVQSLCLGRPIKGYSWVARKGWTQSPAIDIHWYASAIVASVRKVEEISSALYVDVIIRILEPWPQEGDFGDVEAFMNAYNERAYYQSSTIEVLEYFYCLLTNNAAPIRTKALASVDDQARLLVDWRMVAESLLVVLRKEAAR